MLDSDWWVGAEVRRGATTLAVLRRAEPRPRDFRKRLCSRLRAAFTRVPDNWPQQGCGWAGPAGGRGLCLQASTWAGFILVKRLGFASDENRASAH